ncbi:MAG: glycoside hydrolase, partial [Actinomycetota bacterium]|nr:glycoside hydrolase [Actinomycetota bacterium]
YVYVDQATARVFTLDTTQAAGSEMSFSDNGGESWTHTLVDAAGLNDHMTLVSAPAPAGSGLTPSDPAFPRLLHYCANSLEITSCVRSVDGGHTFTQEGTPFVDANGFCGALTGHLAADGQGRIFLASSFNHNTVCPPHPLVVAASDDGGTNWRSSTVSTTILDAEHDGELSTDKAGNVYVVWEDDLHRLPYLAVSRDHGRTWGPPMMIAPPGVSHARFSKVTAGDAGRIAVSFIATPVRNEGDATRPWAYYMAVSTDVLGTHPTFRSAVAPIPGESYPVVHRGPCTAQCAGLFDFLDLTLDPRPSAPFVGSLSDNCTGPCVANPRGNSTDSLVGIGLVVSEVAGPRLAPPAVRRR